MSQQVSELCFPRLTVWTQSMVRKYFEELLVGYSLSQYDIA
jgi:hypothetical protein